jgi:hypothetical protein
MKSYKELQQEILAFLKDFLRDKTILRPPRINEDTITAEIIVQKNNIVTIEITIGEFMTEIELEAYLGANNENYENISIQTRIINIPNDDIKGLKIIKALQQVYPKFEKIITQTKQILEEQNA